MINATIKTGQRLALSREKGHLFIEVDNDKWFVDTGCDLSFSDRRDSVTLDGIRCSIDHKALPLARPWTVDKLIEDVGVECVGLLGMDILGRYDWIFHRDSALVSKAALIDEDWQRDDESYSTMALDFWHGLPFIAANINHLPPQRVLFDTGCQYSYMDPLKVAPGMSIIGELNDFSPLDPNGTLDTYWGLLYWSVGDARFNHLKTGYLIRNHGLTWLLKAADSSGILGNEWIEHGIQVGFFPRRKRLVIEHPDPRVSLYTPMCPGE